MRPTAPGTTSVPTSCVNSHIVDPTLADGAHYF